jgi:hypothetical protein
VTDRRLLSPAPLLISLLASATRGCGVGGATVTGTYRFFRIHDALEFKAPIE